MRVLRERGDRRGTDSLSWRIRGSEFWVFAFQFLEFAEQAIVLRVR
jgi:hypothetical protein